MSTQKARKMKIRIVAEGKRIWIPPIYFWFLRFLWAAGGRFILRAALKEGKNSAVLKELDVPAVLNELARCGPFVLVDVEVVEDKTKVFIEIQ
jgi:hypothetical protein